MDDSKNFDGSVLQLNNKFLSNLIRDRYTPTKIRFKIILRNESPKYITIQDYKEFYKIFEFILSHPKPQGFIGKKLILESLELNNEKLKFPNTYYIRNINSKLEIQKSFKYDIYRQKFNSSQSDLFQRNLLKNFTDYLTQINDLIKERENPFINPWIDEYTTQIYLGNEFDADLIGGVLQKLDNFGKKNGNFNASISGGGSLSSEAQTAKTNLISKGWTIEGV